MPAPDLADAPAVLRAAAAILAARGRIEIPNAADNDTDPVDASPLARILEALGDRDRAGSEEDCDFGPSSLLLAARELANSILAATPRQAT